MHSQIEQRPTFAYVDLDVLARNFHSVRAFAGTDLKYMAVVKADGYGHGAVKCSQRLEYEGIDWFGVAIPEEGVQLRTAGIKKPILCLGSFFPGQEGLIVDHELTPVIYDFATAAGLNSYAAKLGSVIDVHIKIDTGMGRVGTPYSEATNLAQQFLRFDNLRISGLMTHFAAAENPVENVFTELQIDRFNEACDVFRRAGFDPKWISLANSPAAIRHPAALGNLVRLGGAMYGLLDDILPEETVRPQLEPVLTLRSKIAHIKDVPVGESLGYGRTFVTKKPSRIALIPIGYADGYPRGLSNLGHISVNGSLAPIVGRLSMDWTLIDVTDVTDAASGSDVVLIGSDIKATDIARAVGTIGYEITCGLSPRIPRIYE